MRVADKWKDYELLDASYGERLERWGDIILIRPDPQIIWNTNKDDKLWNRAHARYVRSNSGGGHWEKLKKVPDVWEVSYNKMCFQIKMMGFKHTGLFPEQAVNWDFTYDLIKKSRDNLSILNLFSYTGAATISCAKAGAKVCHVDASKGMVTWARDNAVISNVADKPLRWIVDDCIKFVLRENRRGNKYDGIIMDPPSYGRGPGGEVWKLEEKLFDFLQLVGNLLSDNAKFLILNSYTSGLAPSVMQYMLDIVIKSKKGGFVFSDEIGLPVTQSGLILPCGSTAIWTSSNVLI